MLEAITDFWKPAKKAAQPAKLKLTDMQVGSVISFGYVPQATLSGQKFTVYAINSYQFGADVLTSFALRNEKDAEVSLIIAEAQGEQYLAISRRISASDRSRLFDVSAVNEIISKNELNKFSCKDNVPELKGWLVTNYKREIQGMRGNIYKADFRDGRDGLMVGEEFQYTLLGSNSNEHAIEIEDYGNGRIDIYATVYRRTSDISDVVYATGKTLEKPHPSDMKLVSISEAIPSVEEDKIKDIQENQDDKKNVESLKSEQVKLEPVKLESVALPQLTATPLVEEIKKDDAIIIEETKNNNEEKKDMSITTVLSSEPKPTLTNGRAGVVESTIVPSFGNAAKDFKQEIKTVTKATNGLDNEAIECELRVANQIIEEAIRNEMRLSDVVRRIIELPVAHQEAVQIPLNLADEDFSLLAIRYGIPSSDRNAIKLRIIQELGDFSGSKKKAA